MCADGDGGGEYQEVLRPSAWARSFPNCLFRPTPELVVKQNLETKRDGKEDQN